MTATEDYTQLVGVHGTMPAEEYHKLEACSNSKLSVLHDSCPAKVEYVIKNPKQTEAMLIGSALHCLVLEPRLFDAKFAVGPECDKRTKAGKATWDSFEVHCFNSRLTSLKVDQSALVESMAESIAHNDFAMAALANAPEREVSAIWHDVPTGLLCKARFDALGRDAGLIVDLKTTGNAGPDFERSIDDYGYARQAAFYIHGAAVLKIPVTDFLIIAVEKEPPYLVGLHRITEEAIELAMKELRPLLETFWTCQTTNMWPGYASMDSGLPAWAKKRIEGVK